MAATRIDPPRPASLTHGSWRAHHATPAERMTNPPATAAVGSARVVLDGCRGHSTPNRCCTRSAARETASYIVTLRGLDVVAGDRESQAANLSRWRRRLGCGPVTNRYPGCARRPTGVHIAQGGRISSRPPRDRHPVGDEGLRKAMWREEIQHAEHDLRRIPVLAGCTGVHSRGRRRVAA
jgi:hypothetical protein